MSLNSLPYQLDFSFSLLLPLWYARLPSGFSQSSAVSLQSLYFCLCWCNVLQQYLWVDTLRGRRSDEEDDSSEVFVSR